MKKQNYEPAKAKIYMELNEGATSVEINGSMEDLVFLISVTLQETPDFIKVLKLALDFDNYEKNKNKLLRKAYDFCNENDKSTEFMLQYMQDVADVDLDSVLSFLEEERIFVEKINK